MKKIENELKPEEFIPGSIEKLFSIFCKKYEFCSNHYTEPGIHDLRVSIRRMMSLLFLLENFTDVPYIRDLQKSLGKILKSLNPVRDTQVEVAMMKNLIFKFPVFYTFYIHLLNQEIVQAKKAAKIIAEADREGIEGLVFFLNMYLKQRINDLGLDISKIIDIRKSAFNNLVLKYSQAAKDDVDSIHKVRLALKKYRYLEEALKPVIKLPKERLRQMKSLQDHLGEIQDYTVIINRISSFIFSQSVIPANKYNEAMKYLETTRGGLISDLFGMREGFLEVFAGQ